MRPFLGFATFLILLETLPRIGIVNPAYFPPFSQILAALAQQVLIVEFWIALGQTLMGWALGLTIAVVGGVVLGLVLGANRWLRDFTHSTIEFLRPIPSVALIPLVVLLFGTSMQSTLVLVVYASIWPIIVQVLYGVQDVDLVARDTARSYRLSWWRQIASVIWPSALPFAMTGFRLAAAIALILEITGELIIGSPGIGQRIAVSQSSGAVANMYALVAVTGVLGVAMNILARRLSRASMHWHSSIRRDEVSR
jgi:ABC-type nitrate/sulfonate/bicarbonate transport system permease component